MWVRAVLRRHWRSTVFLALFAGLAAGAVMTAAAYSRRAHTVVERRLVAAAVPDGSFQSCPPGIDPSEDISPCLGFESNGEAFDGLVASQHVSAAKLSVGFAVALRGSAALSRQPLFASAVAAEHGEIANVHIARGESVGDLPIDGVVLGESSARAASATLGDEISLAVCDVFSGAADDCGPVGKLRVAGLARLEGDILPPRAAPPGFEPTPTTFGVFTTLDWWRIHTDGREGFHTTSFRLADGSTFADVRTDLASLLPGWTTLVTPYEDVTVQSALREATKLQARTLFVVALILLVAGAVFVGQALLRQVPRELHQQATLTAVGLDRRTFLVGAALRAVPIAALAGAIAVVAATVASVFGPTGLAGRAEVERGLRPDVPVLLGGAVGVVTFVECAVVAAAWRVTRVRAAGPRRGRRVPGGLPPALQAGLLLGRGRGGTRTLVASTAGVAVAVAAVVWAGVITASLARVVATPERYGASWDYGVGMPNSAGDFADLTAEVRADPLVTDAASLTHVGPVDVAPASPFYVVTLEPLKGELGPIVLEGRTPAAPDEIAVGRQTLEELGLAIGDMLEALPILAAVDDGDGATQPGSTIGPFRIVGTVLVSNNDTTAGPGTGMITTSDVRERLDPGSTGEIVVRVDPSAKREDLLASFAERYGADLTVPTPQSDIRNYDAIASIPTVIALLVCALGIAALVNTLIVSVRRRRRPLAVLRTLGFTSGQIVQAVLAQAAVIAVVGVAVGIPLGAVSGAQTWETRADELGVVAGAVVPGLLLAAVAVGPLVVVHAIALWPGMRAGRDDLGRALRAE